MLRESKRDVEFRIAKSADFWRYHRAFEARHNIVLFRYGWTSEGQISHPTNAEIEKFSMTAEEVEAYVKETWDQHVKPHAHPECEEYFLTYGSASWTNYVAAGGICIVCGTNRFCGETVRKHQFREISQEECRARKIYHGGSCYHVSECLKCGVQKHTDSSD